MNFRNTHYQMTLPHRKPLTFTIWSVFLSLTSALTIMHFTPLSKLHLTSTWFPDHVRHIPARVFAIVLLWGATWLTPSLLLLFCSYVPLSVRPSLTTFFTTPTSLPG